MPLRDRASILRFGATMLMPGILCALTLLAPRGLFAQNSLPVIVNQPQSQNVFARGTAIFTVSASGTQPFTYRWFGPAGLLDNETNATLKLAPVDTSDSGIYYAMVGNQFGSGRSFDARLTVARADFGDAPEPYPTLLDADGARHLLIAGFQLGQGVSFEADGQPDSNAAADSGDDGVVFVTALVPGNLGAVRVFASAAGYLDGWIDFNANRNWGDADENVFASVPLSVGANLLNFMVPATAAVTNTFARFRFSSSGGLRPTGLASDGEVEDYRVQIVAAGADLDATVSISPDPVPPPNIGRCTLTISNVGPLSAVNVLISNTLPGVTFFPLPTASANCLLQNDTIICGFGDLQPGEVRSLVVSFRPIRPSLITNTLTVHSDVFDPRPANNKDIVVVRAAAPLIIMSQPKSQKVISGSSVTFSVEAKGVGPLKYQWESDGALIAGETASTLTLDNVRNSAQLRVLVTDTIGPVWSQPATLSVFDPARILLQPTAVTTLHGNSAQFLVRADGTAPLKYQWRINGVNIRGATNPVYQIDGVNRADGGTYTVAVANRAGVTVSDPVPLICQDIPFLAPADNSTAPLRLPPPGISPYDGVIQTDNSNATTEPNEPIHADKPGGGSVWFVWTAPANGIASFDTIGSTFDTLIGIYTGTSSGGFVTVASDEDSGGYLRSLVRFNAQAGQSYLIAVDGFNGKRGVAVLAWYLEQTTQVLPIIVSHPQSRTGADNTLVTLSINAIGGPQSPNLSYQWFFNGSLFPGANGPTLTIPLVPKRVGNYTVRVSNDFGRSVESRPATIEIGSVPGIQSTDKPEDLLLNSGGPGFRAASAISGGSPFVSVAFGIPGSQIVNNTNSTADIDCFGIGNATRWLGLQLPSDPSTAGSVLRVDTSGSPIATELGVYQYAGVFCIQNLACMHANIRGCDTNSGGGGSYSLVQFPPLVGGQYLVFMDGLGGAEGLINLHWQLGAAPTINLAQSNCTLLVAAGTDVMIPSGITNGIPPPTFQWYYYGAPLLNQTNSALTFTPIQSSNAGCYSVVASNFAGMVTNNCCLIVDPPRLRYKTDLSAYPPVCNISAALLPGCILQFATNLTPSIFWQNVVTNATTNCNFQFAAPFLDTNGVPIPQRIYRTRTP